MGSLIALVIIFLIFVVNKIFIGKFFSLESVLPIYYLFLLFLLTSGVYLHRDVSVITISSVVIFSSVLYFFSILLSGININTNIGMNTSFYNRIERVTIVLAFLLLLYISFYLPQAVKYIFFDSMANYRKNVNGFSDGSSLLFGEGFSLFFYQFFFKGVLISLSISSSIIYFVKGIKKPLYLTTLIIILDCFVSFGRFIIYYHFISFIIAGFFYRKVDVYKLFKISSFLLAFVIGFTLFRFENFSNIYSVIFRNMIGYHVFGFSLFDEFVKNNPIIIHEWSGSAFLSNIQYVVQKVLNIVGIDVSTLMSSELYRGLSNFVYLGKDIFGDDVYANAFYTNLLDMYLDAGLFSLFVYSCFISVLYAISLALAKKDNFNILKVFLFVYMFLFIYFGVFNSQMLLLRNVFSLILLSFIFIFSKKFVLYKG